MKLILIASIATLILGASAACSWIGFGAGEDVPEESSATPDINATIAAAVAKALAEAQKSARNEATAAPQITLVPTASNGQTNWLDGLSQFHRIKVARDEVGCVGYDNGRYTSSHAIIRVDDGYYALGNPGQAVVFYANNDGCRIGVITDETLE